MDSTKIAIVKGTLGRRIHVERYRFEQMKQESDFKNMSNRHSLLTGLLIAQEIMKTLEAEEETPS